MFDKIYDYKSMKTYFRKIFFRIIFYLFKRNCSIILQLFIFTFKNYLISNNSKIKYLQSFYF